MDRSEAERLYDSGKYPTVEKLLDYDRQNTELKERIVRLESNSQSSSKPPSSDIARERKEKKKGSRKSRKRKPGGQPGHPGTNRELVPPDKVDVTIPCYAKECPGCPYFEQCRKHSLSQQPASRWQVTEIPSVKPTVSEYQLYTLSGRCGKVHRVTLPPEVTRSNFGPRLTAMISYFIAVLHQPRRVVQDCFKDRLWNYSGLGFYAESPGSNLPSPCPYR
jgi:transposase